MPRPQRPLDPKAGPIQAFAAELRTLHLDAGKPKFIAMQRQTGRSRTALSEAVGGDHLPTWETVEAFVTGCGGKPLDWRGRWQATYDAVHPSTTRATETSPAHEPVKEVDGQDAEASASTAGVNTHRPLDPPIRVRRWAWPRQRSMIIGIAVAAAAVSGVMTAVARSRHPVSITGTVSCSAPVTGIWIKAEDGRGSGWASWSPTTDRNHVRFNYRLPDLASWTVNVGCGGTTGVWKDSVNGVRFTTSLYQDWHCSTAPTAYGCQPA